MRCIPRTIEDIHWILFSYLNSAVLTRIFLFPTDTFADRPILQKFLFGYLTQKKIYDLSEAISVIVYINIRRIFIHVAKRHPAGVALQRVSMHYFTAA